MPTSEIEQRAASIFGRMVEERRRDQERDRALRAEQQRLNDEAARAHLEDGAPYPNPEPETTPDGRAPGVIAAECADVLDATAAHARMRIAAGNALTDAERGLVIEKMKENGGEIGALRREYGVTRVGIATWERAERAIGELEVLTGWTVPVEAP